MDARPWTVIMKISFIYFVIYLHYVGIYLVHEFEYIVIYKTKITYNEQQCANEDNAHWF